MSNKDSVETLTDMTKWEDERRKHKDSELVKPLSSRLAALRIEANLKQAELAKNLSNLSDTKTLSISLISSWESGTKVPTVPSLIRLARYYDVSVDYILGIDDARNRKHSNAQRQESDYLYINYSELENYENEAIYVTYTDNSDDNFWGIYKKHRIFSPSKTLDVNPMSNEGSFNLTRCKFSLIKSPTKMSTAGGLAEIDMLKMIKASTVYVEMMTPNETLRGEMNGWYKKNLSNSLLINSSGATLNFEGLGKYYKAYLPVRVNGN